MIDSEIIQNIYCVTWKVIFLGTNCMYFALAESTVKFIEQFWVSKGKFRRLNTQPYSAYTLVFITNEFLWPKYILSERNIDKKNLLATLYVYLTKYSVSWEESKNGTFDSRWKIKWLSFRLSSYHYTQVFFLKSS